MICPVCRAQNERGPLCRRCRADLSLLFQVEDQRRHALDEAAAHAARGEWSDALACLDRVDALRRGADATRLRAAVRLLQRDFAQAWQCHQAAAADR